MEVFKVLKDDQMLQQGKDDKAMEKPSNEDVII